MCACILAINVQENAYVSFILIINQLIAIHLGNYRPIIYVKTLSTTVYNAIITQIFS